MARPNPGARILWACLAALYLAFLAWYDYSGGPLTPKEIDHYEQLLQQQGLEGTHVPEQARAFAEEDDGREFFMVNLENKRDAPHLPADLPPGTDPKAAASPIQIPYYEGLESESRLTLRGAARSRSGSRRGP